jgi:hypothetical protein
MMYIWRIEYTGGIYEESVCERMRSRKTRTHVWRWRNPRDVMGRICPECHSSSSIERKKVEGRSRKGAGRELQVVGQVVWADC